MVTRAAPLELFQEHFEYDGDPKVTQSGKIVAPDDVVLKSQFYTAHSELPVAFESVGGTLMLANNKLTTLKGCPQHVGYSFECEQNELTSLEFGPKTVGANYNCSRNELKDLTHAPAHVPGVFNCALNPLESLEGFPEFIGKAVYISYSPDLPLLRTLVAQSIIFWPTVATQGVAAREILNKYAGQGRRGAFDCRRELRAAGFEGNARW